MTFYGVTCTAVLEALVIGVVILADRREQPLFPPLAGSSTSGWHCCSPPARS